jgi:hypothetical protein
VVATNELGHQLAKAVGDVMTLGAYRRGHRLPWIPGATIDVWVPCPRSEGVTGVPSPHVYFVQTIGGKGAENGSIHCPTCRADLAERRVAGATSPPPVSPRSAPPRAVVSATGQEPLPF